MVDINKLKSALDGYKRYFPSHWQDEKYKWIAVKHFQENWDINALNFGEMFERATEQEITKNLLTSARVYPRGILTSI